MGAVMAAVVGVACFAQADNIDDAKARRKARKEQVEQLVKAGDAAEGADGYLAAKAGLEAAKAALVGAENTDRKIGYEAIAKANGKTAEEIGRKAGEINRGRAKK
jgi:uncharacterized protein YdbL (DUF1318 family)